MNNEIYILKLTKVELDWITQLVSLSVASSSKRFHEIEIPEDTYLFRKLGIAKQQQQPKRITDPGPWHDYH